MPEKIKRYFLKAKETEIILKKASERLRVDFRQIFKAKIDVELVQGENVQIYLINGKPFLARIGEDVFPTLTSSEFLMLIPKVVVDMPAVPRICNGANVMAPGIVRYEGGFRKGDLVFIVDERHGKTIALGEIMHDTEEAKTLKAGIVVKNIHYVGDRIWNLTKKLA